jgi:hypothetical protein
MKIRNMQRINIGNDNLTKAIFDVDFKVMVVPDWKLMSDRKGGLWAAAPRKNNGRDGAVRITDPKIMDVITHAAREVFESGGKEGGDVALG